MSERQRTIAVQLSEADLREAAGAPPGAKVTITGGYSDPRESSPGSVTVTWTEAPKRPAGRD